MKISTCSMTPESLAAFGTEHCHMLLAYLLSQKMISVELYEELTSKIIITAIQNKKSFGKKILNHFFSKDSTEDDYVFVIAELPTVTKVKQND